MKALILPLLSAFIALCYVTLTNRCRVNLCLSQVKASSLASVRVLTSVNYTQPEASEQEARQKITDLALERSAVAVRRSTGSLPDTTVSHSGRAHIVLG